MGYIGEYQVEAGKTTTQQYVLCERFYSQALEDVLTEHPWNEAKKRVYVLQSSTDPLFGFTYKFQLPSDNLRILRLGDGANDYSFWEVEGDYIMSNIAQSARSYSVGDDYVAGQYITYSDVTYSVDTSFTATDWTTDLAAYLTTTGGDYKVLKLEYIQNLTDTTKWSPKLTDAIAQKLAILTVVGITNDPKSKQQLLSEFETLTMRKARSVDAMQGRLRPYFKSGWWRTRNSGRGCAGYDDSAVTGKPLLP
jgi:hypothetical protein